MTADTGVMRIGCCTYQRGICMTGATLRSRYGHDNRMVKRGGRMQGFPGAGMTGGTITASAEGLADR